MYSMPIDKIDVLTFARPNDEQQVMETASTYTYPNSYLPTECSV